MMELGGASLQCGRRTVPDRWCNPINGMARLTSRQGQGQRSGSRMLWDAKLRLGKRLVWQRIILIKALREHRSGHRADTVLSDASFCIQSKVLPANDSRHRALTKQTPSSWFCSQMVHEPAKPKPSRNHSMPSKLWMVRRAVLNERNLPTYGMSRFIQTRSLSTPYGMCLVT
jgi:hypothetical protein